MAKDVIDYQPSDTSTKTSGEVTHDTKTGVVHIVNDLGVQLNYVIEATHTGDADNFDDAHELVNTSVSSSTVTSEPITDEPWDYIRVKTTPNSSPSGSNDVRVKHHTQN